MCDMINSACLGRPIAMVEGAGIFLKPLPVDHCVRMLKALTQVPLSSPACIRDVAGDEVLKLREILGATGVRLSREHQ
jgi:hypothetical protein